MNPQPIKLVSADIEDSVKSFTEKDNTLLCLAGRYDGLDLPGDDCRLLIMTESPGAVGALERYQREHWKLGPLLRHRERTRLIQGMGRCTRDATDYAVIILLGQSLLNSVTTSSVSQGLPGEIQRELAWGIAQGEVVKEDKEGLMDMVIGLLTDSEYRKDANECLEEDNIPSTILDSKSYDEIAKLEVHFSRAIWDSNYSKAYELARTATDKITDPELSGYLAWWFYLGSIAAHLLDETDLEIDCLKRARAIGINSGYLDYLIRNRSGKSAVEKIGDVLDAQAEGIWNQLEQCGWHGPKFSKSIEAMTNGLKSQSNATQFHIGLECLGRCLGAEAIRPPEKEKGAPDVVWIFPEQAFTFEAKSNKKGDGALSKKNVLQAKAHPDWLIAKRKDLSNISIQPVILSPTKSIDHAAKPHTINLYFFSTKSVLKWAEAVAISIKEIRTEFSGKEYGAVLKVLKQEIKQHKLDIASIKKVLSYPLSDG